MRERERRRRCAWRRRRGRNVATVRDRGPISAASRRRRAFARRGVNAGRRLDAERPRPPRVGYYDEQLTSVDEFVSLPDAVVLGCVSEERRGEPYEVSGLIQTLRLLTVEVHSVIAGELSEDATLTLVAPGWAEIYEVEREVWEGRRHSARAGDWLVLALDEETDDTCRMFSDQGAIRLSDDGPEFPPSAGLLVADLGDDADSEELLAELREAAKR
ncbi:hypothetical protein BH20ACT8_BH20ACT8_04870 [soil metagenome]